MLHNLNPLKLPLQGQQLIEASAGTGKTYTLSALYLRLVLGHQQLFDQGERILLPPDILVMTFTEAATAELRERIRLRLQEAKFAFQQGSSSDPLLSALLNEFAPENYELCVQKLSLAIEWMDEAAIFTIHGWASRMLRQHAFDSLSLFEQTLVEDTHQLKLDACKRYWRQVYYALEPDAIRAVQAWVTNPEALLALINDQKGKPEESLGSDWLIEPRQALEPWLEWQTQLAGCFKQLQQRWTDEVTALIQSAKASKALKGNSYQEGWIKQLLNWLKTGQNAPSLKQLTSVSTGGFVTSNKGSAPDHPAFDVMASYVRLVQQEPDYQSALLKHAQIEVNRLYQQAKHQAGLFDFDDLLHQLYQALQGEAGESLAQAIRSQFPVALVDEFQDTDPWQYGCLMPLYQQREDCLLLMIGDPKQAIYRFRGADMDTYLRARKDALHHHTLTQNFRSSEFVIRAVNQLFALAETHPQGAFQFRQGEENPIAFVEVSAGKQLPGLKVAGQDQAAITLWAQEAGKCVTKDSYLTVMSAQCANEIARLLGSADTGFALEEGLKPLEAKDIAVLVRNRNEAVRIQQALREKRIPSVYLSDKESVFSSEEALDVWRWLQAVHEPESISAIRAALASRSFAFSLAELDSLRDNESAWDEWVTRFRAWRDTWQQQGVLAMLYRLLHEQGISHYWQQQVEGERKLTNLLHLAEVLQQASLEREGRTALIRWLASHISQPQVSTAQEHLVRLESDASCITIITIHKSKGLEYPLVFLPFAMSLGMNKRQVTDEQERELDWQESIRLLYVALTRASHALWLGVAGLKSSANSAGFYESALGYLLSGDRRGDDETLWAEAFQPWLVQADALMDWQPVEAIDVNNELIDEMVSESVSSSIAAQAVLLPKVRHWPYWQLSSYSRLTQQLNAQRISASEFRLLEDQTLERQAVFDDDSHSDLPLFQISAIETPWQSLPAGAGVGDLMHLALEAMLMESPIEDTLFWSSFWQQQLSSHHLPLTLEMNFHAWLTTLAAHPIRLISSEPNNLDLGKLCKTQRDGGLGEGLHYNDIQPIELNPSTNQEIEIGSLNKKQSALFRPSLSLNQLKQGVFCCEMGFTLPLSQTHSQAIDDCVSAMVLAGVARPKLSYQRLGGLLTGFMDLIFEYDGRYYVLDYKTNKLMQGYDDWSCQQGILSHRYDVQAMLYVLALHRYLSTRIANYDYDRHMGGAIYWFIRGADPLQPQQGVWHCKPSLAELESLSHIFSSQSL